MDPSGNHIDYIIENYQRNTRDFIDNIHEYNSIMRLYMNNRINNPYSRQYINTPPVAPIHNNIINNPYSRIYNTPMYNSRTTRFERNTPNYEDVVVRPTNDQIASALETYLYGSLDESHTCPITLEPIVEGEEVCRIRHCGHIFKKNAIYGWFSQNVRCPVCRFDIRDYITPRTREEAYSQHQRQQQQQHQQQEQQQEEQQQQDYINQVEIEYELNNQMRIESDEESKDDFSELFRGFPDEIPSVRTISQTHIAGVFTNAIRSFVNQELQRLPVNAATTDLIYSFDLPLSIDPSGNYRL